MGGLINLKKKGFHWSEKEWQNNHVRQRLKGRNREGNPRSGGPLDINGTNLGYQGNGRNESTGRYPEKQRGDFRAIIVTRRETVGGGVLLRKSKNIDEVSQFPKRSAQEDTVT